MPGKKQPCQAIYQRMLWRVMRIEKAAAKNKQLLFLLQGKAFLFYCPASVMVEPAPEFFCNIRKNFRKACFRQKKKSVIIYSENIKSFFRKRFTGKSGIMPAVTVQLIGNTYNGCTCGKNMVIEKFVLMIQTFRKTSRSNQFAGIKFSPCGKRKSCILIMSLQGTSS